MTREEIVSVLADLHRITGFRVSLHAADYSEIAAYPEEKCALCRLVHGVPGEYDKCVASDKIACKSAMDKKGTHLYRCRYGMTEAISPLYNFGTLTGFLMMGQVYEDGVNRAAHMRTLSNMTGLTAEIESIMKNIPDVAAEMVPSYVRIMTICAQYLTLSNAIPSHKPSIAELAKEYIYHNYSRKINIKMICSEVGCSKSTLLATFKKTYGITVNAYITDVRLGEALRMLAEEEYKISEIAEACGFSDQSYFTKVFFAKYGVPPSSYKKIPEVGEFFWR